MQNERKSRARIGFIVLIIFSIMYLPSLAIWIFKDKIDTAFVDIGNIEIFTNSSAIIVRDEDVMIAPFKGKYVAEVSQGDKVKANATVATVIKESAEELFKEERMLDLNILQVQKAKEENREIFSDDISKLDDEIKKNIKLIVEESATDRMMQTDRIKADIDFLIQKKVSIIGGAGSSDAYLNSLKQQKEKVKGKLSLQKNDIISNASGIVSYSVDGYEKELNPALLSELTPDIFDKIRTNGRKQISNSTSVDAGKPFVKVVKNIYCYIVVCIDKQKAEQFDVNSSIKVRINDINKVVDARACFKSNEIQGKYILAIKTDKAMSDMSALRCIDVDLITKSYSGLMVPLRSLKDVDYSNMKAKIMLIKANTVRETEVKILGKNDKYAILEEESTANKSGVSLYSTYIVDPKNIREGQMLE